MSTRAVSVPAERIVSLYIDNLEVLDDHWTTYTVPFEVPGQGRMVSVSKSIDLTDLELNGSLPIDTSSYSFASRGRE